MDLRNWRKVNNVTLKQLSEKTGIPLTTLQLLDTGDIPKVVVHMYKIQNVTWNQVTFEDFVRVALEREEKKKNPEQKSKEECP